MREPLLSQELVPLQEAAAAAYHVLGDHGRRAASEHQLGQVRGQVAMALAAVARIVLQESGGTRAITVAELESRFSSSVSAPNEKRLANPDLSDLYIRRSDLLRAIELLKESRSSFPS